MNPIVPQNEEIKTIDDVKKYLTPGAKTVVLFNITNTLYKSSCTMTDHAWRQYFDGRVKALVTQGKIEDGKSKEYIKAEHHKLTEFNKEPVEPRTPVVVSDLQKQNITVFGLTEKNPVAFHNASFDKFTSDHLKKIGIDLEQTLNYTTLKPADPNADGELRYAIVFRKKDKETKPDIGKAVAAVLKRLEFQPDALIVVENKQKEIDKVKESINSLGIKTFIGLRYGHTDERKAKLDINVGTIQYLHYKKTQQLLTDAQALEQLKLCKPEELEASLDQHVMQSVQGA